MDTKQRIVFIDYIRVIACFLVMLVHASENFYCVSADTSMLANESNRFYVALYDGGFGRISVPLFMVVSAFLLVPMQDGMSMSAFYKRRFLRVLPPMVLFMVLYCFMPMLWGQLSWSEACHDFCRLPFTFPSIAGHLWFMYPLISLYIIIPVVSPWLREAKASDERLFLIFFVISTLVPWLSRLVGTDLWGTCFWNPYFGMFYYCSGYLGYLVMAHYIREHLRWSRARRLKIGVLAFAVGSLFTAWSFWHAGIPNVEMKTPSLEWSWEFCTPNVLFATFGAFLMFTCIDSSRPPRWLEGLSRLTFGMYLIHILYLVNISTIIIGDSPASPHLPVWLAIPIIAIFTYVCSALTCWLISHLPGSRWIIGS